jgi:hypothetical protein
MGESKRRRQAPRESERETEIIRVIEPGEDVGPFASKGGWLATNAERAVRLSEFHWTRGEHFTLMTFGANAYLAGNRADDSLVSAIVEQALAWLKGPPATAPQCCICGRTFLRPMGPVRPEGPCFSYLRKARHDDGVVMAMLYCREHVDAGEHDDALAAVVEDRLGLKPVATTRA